MESNDKPFDPHALLPKDHPHHPDNVTSRTESTTQSSEKKTIDSPIDDEKLKVTEVASAMGPIATPPIVSTTEQKKGDSVKHTDAFKTEKKHPPIGLILGILFLLVLGGGAYYGMSQGYFNFSQGKVISPAGTPGKVEKKVTVGSMEGWKTYTSSESGFTIRHPESVNATVLREGEQVVTVFTLVGPTQKANTEFYDGISLQFMSGELTGSTLEEVTKKESTELAEHAKITKEVAPVTVSGINGYTYSASGVGDVVFIYLPDGGGYLKVANLTKDPTNQGYEKIVSDMLSTFRFTAEGTGEEEN